LTLGQVIARARTDSHLPISKREDLEYVVAAVCGWDRSGLLARLSLPCDENLTRAVEEAAKRLASGCPAEYITGQAAFCDLQVRVCDGVLIPRPETEDLVLLAKDIVVNGHNPNAVILDLCSGSGAIALALASELPHATCIGLELDPVAVSCSLASSSDAALGGRTKFLRGNVLSSWDLLLSELKGSHVDLIVSNPPYVREGRLDDARAASPLEPVHALYGGRSGLVFYKRITAQAASWLRPGGTLLFEIDDGLEEGILNLFERYGLQKGRWLPDFRGLPRYAEAQRGT
jgi:release factor glutamine methyltransferase